MLDDDLKKMLHDLDMDDLAEELEKSAPSQIAEQNQEPVLQSKPSINMNIVRYSLIGLAAIVGASFIGMKMNAPVNQQAQLIAYNDDDQDDAAEDDDDSNNDDDQAEEEDEFHARENKAAMWARDIMKTDPDIGKSVHELWDTLSRRKEELQVIADELSTLLYDNASMRQDFYAQSANVLLSRYQAVDARYCLQAGNQINSLYSMVKAANNPDLERYYAEMLGELGGDAYSTYQVQILKQLLKEEMAYDQAIEAVGRAKSIAELDSKLLVAQNALQVLEMSGIAQTFSQVAQYQKQLLPACQKALDSMLFESTQGLATSPEMRARLDNLLEEIGASEEQATRYLQQFDHLAEQAKKVAPAKTTSSFVTANDFSFN